MNDGLVGDNTKLMEFTLLFSLLTNALSLTSQLFTNYGFDYKTPQVVVLSFDGFRWDYVNRYSTPNFDRIGQEGVKAEFGYRSTFATKTFPTHMTLATGLFEEAHGIIDNRFYDPDLNDRKDNDPKWFNGEPIWVTAKKQGKRAHVLFWPASNVPFASPDNESGILPDYWQNYSDGVSFEDRFDSLLKWWIKDDVPLSMVYFHQPDRAGHEYGVFTENVKREVERIDTLLGQFLERLDQMNKLNDVNLIVLSDHGMVNLTDEEEPQIYLSDYLDLQEEVSLVPQTGPVAGIIPKPGKGQIVFDKLKDHPKMTVYMKEMIPQRFHYKANRRITPIVAIAKQGHVILEQRKEHKSKKVGFHGYDNMSPDMNPIFFARGPDFKSNFKVDPFDAVNVYSLICHLLRITPFPNHGSLNNVKHLLNQFSLNHMENILQSDPLKAQ